MRIGLTYDLREVYLQKGYDEQDVAELDKEETIAGIESTLASLGHEVVRIGHVDELFRKLLAGERWELVFNIAEGMHGMGRESLVPALLDHYRVPYTFSDPLTLALSLHKGMAKRVLRDAGVLTAPFVVVETPDDVASVDLPLPLFAKPVAEGTGKGITARSIVRERADLLPLCCDLLARHQQPVLVETYLPGREVTIGVVGTGAAARAIGTLEIHLLPQAEQGVYSYVNKENYQDLCEYRVVRADQDPMVKRAEERAVAAWRAMGARDAGRIDLRCDEQGEPRVIELNPLAGLNPKHSDLPILCAALGIEYRQLLKWIVDSAAQRVSR